MAAKEETGDAKRHGDVEYPLQTARPYGIQATRILFVLGRVRRTRRGADGTRSSRTTWSSRQQGQRTGAAMVGAFRRETRSFVSPARTPMPRPAAAFGIGLLVGLPPHHGSDCAWCRAERRRLPKARVPHFATILEQEFLGPAPHKGDRRSTTCSQYMTMTSRVDVHRGNCRGLCRFFHMSYQLSGARGHGVDIAL